LTQANAENRVWNPAVHNVNRARPQVGELSERPAFTYVTK